MSNSAKQARAQYSSCQRVKMEGTCTDRHISSLDSNKGRYSAEGKDMESGARSLAVAWHTLLVGLEVGIKICEAPKDAASLVEVDWKLFGFTVTGTDCEERGDNGIESNLKVQRSCCRVVGDALQVVAMREVQSEVDAFCIITGLVAVSQIKVALPWQSRIMVFKLSRVTKQLVAQRLLELSCPG